MAYTEHKIQRRYIGKDYQEAMELPDLINIQLSSYERFLQRDRIRAGQAPDPVGLEEVFRNTFPIESPSGDMLLEFERYGLDESAMKYSEIECKQKGLTYAVPLKARINLVFQKTGEIRQKEIYLGDIPLMTERGTFIVNGAERVVVSQIHRSPGVIFCHDKGVFSARIIPYRGSWLEFEIDQKKELIYAKIDRKKRILGTMFLRALGFDTRESILAAFYKSRTIELGSTREEKEKAVACVLSKPIAIDVGGEMKRLYRAGDKLHLHDIDE
ncbi:MAG: DNA-directed RNA polymerase subunit beta, partial [Rectinemataceae bacterium]